MQEKSVESRKLGQQQRPKFTKAPDMALKV